MDTFPIVVIVLVAGGGSFAVVAGFVAMLASGRRIPSRVSKSRIAPGWYPDAQDDTLLRYFDGRVPTPETSRRGSAPKTPRRGPAQRTSESDATHETRSEST